MLVVIGSPPVNKLKEVVHQKVVQERLGHANFPTRIVGQMVLLFLVADRRHHHTFYYIGAREATGQGALKGSRKWRVCSLGTELPWNEVDALRQAIYLENLRRQSVTICAQL